MRPKSPVLIGAAGAATAAANVLMLTVASPELHYVALLNVILAAAAGVGSVLLASRPPTLRSALLSLAAFAAGVVVVILVFALYTHLEDLADRGVKDPRHGVVWPLFAVIFVATTLFSSAVFFTAAFVTSAIVRYLDSKPARPRLAA